MPSLLGGQYTFALGVVQRSIYGEQTKMRKNLVGVVAIQGDYDKHILAVKESGAEAREIRTAEDLEGVHRVIIPGGESTTVSMLLQRYGLADALTFRVQAGMPIWGTCMGMILMARTVENRPEQYSLRFLDITVRRNAFGAQVHSFEDEVTVTGLDEPSLAVFIRAPVVTQLGPDVHVVSEYKGQVVAVRQGNRLGTSFHPELTSDRRFHQWFLSFAA